jgi:hypothetical protein
MPESTPFYFKSILRAPCQEDLFELFEVCKTNLGQPCSVDWLAKGPINPKLVLTAIAYRNERSEWHGKETVGIDPEWQLDLEDDERVRKTIWRALKTSDLTLVLSLIPDLDEVPQEIPPEPISKIGLPFPDEVLGRFSGSRLKRSVLTRMQRAAETPSAEPPRQGERGMVLAGNVKDINVSDVLQSINFCKMTGKMNVYDVDRYLELYFCDGEVIHARAVHALLKSAGQLEGKDALLDLFCWDEGTFNFQPGYTSVDRSIDSGLQGVLMEGAMLKDYRSYLKKENLSRKSRLARAPNKVQISEAEFDKELKNGIDVHIDLQKQIFVDLKETQQLDQIIGKYQLTNLVWIPIIFNLLSLRLIVIVPA